MKALQHGTAKQGTAIYHNEHRSKKNRRPYHNGRKRYQEIKRRRGLVFSEELLKETLYG